LIIDITNPSPSIGWSNQERSSFSERAKADVVMALALIHHLAISNNLPLIKIFQDFSKMANYLIIEFVPKEDSQVQRLLSTREDIFYDYTLEGFTNAVKNYYSVIKKIPISESNRMVFLLEKK